VPARPAEEGVATEEERERERAEEQEKVDNAVMLTEEEQLEKEALSSQVSWVFGTCLMLNIC
jgi:SWI/SNF-related matrix-associated actin-dependent regulator of chromatin subfamily A member 5